MKFGDARHRAIGSNKRARKRSGDNRGGINGWITRRQICGVLLEVK
jgi:hypothetical protein